MKSAALKLYRKSALPSASSAHAKDEESEKLAAKRNVGYNTVLLVYQTLPGSMRRLVTSKVISLARSDSIQIDVTEIVQNWIDEPGMNQGIEIECTSQNISQIVTLSSDSAHQPSLDILTYEMPISVRRKKRDVNIEENCRRNKCCRRPVEILYSEVDIHIGSHPFNGDSFTAYVCSGSCPLGHKLFNTWSMIKNTLRARNSSSYKNHCAPTEYDEEFGYMTTDADGFDELVIQDDIIVTKCACQ